MLKDVSDRRHYVTPQKKTNQLHLSTSSESAGLTGGCCHGSCGSSLEVVSQERFQQQLEAMSSSVDGERRCKPQQQGQSSFSQRMSRCSRGKRNMPIVVCLRESIRNHGARRSGKLGTLPGNRRTMSESSASVADVSVQTVISMSEQLPSSAPPTDDKKSKNFAAFLSVIEKVQAKGQRFNHSLQNVDRKSTRHALNASVSGVGSALNNEDPRVDTLRPLALTRCKNVDVIHNDLRCPTLPFSDDHSDHTEPESSSDRSSSSESDTDPSDDLAATDGYDVSPQHCPKCLAAYYAYTHYYALGSKYFKIEVIDDESNMEDAACSSEADETRRSSWKPFTDHRHIDVISMDLTGSDVTFTVEQLTVNSSNTSGEDSSSARSPPNPHSSPEFSHNFYCTMFGFVPCLPGYCFVPAYYFTFPMWSVSKPPLPSIDKANLSICHPVGGQRMDSHCSFVPSLPAAPQRPWVHFNQPEKNKPVAVFNVMCYNVLCAKYATRQLYHYCPSWALNWQHRKRHIFQEIHQYGADIICLQEVETEQFYNFFLPELQAEGYDGIFSPKSRAKTMTMADRKHVDGCAIFYRHSKFRLISEHLVEFNQLAIETARGSHDMINRVMTKDNIGLAALLETKPDIWSNVDEQTSDGFEARQLLLVATCHIHWDPDYSDVKLIQTMMLMNELKNITEDVISTSVDGDAGPPKAIPLMLCGDFNSLPDSGVVEFLNAGRLSANHKDFKDIGYEDSLHKLSVSDSRDVYSHAFQLAQAYTPDLMPYTNYTCDFKGIIDYVFYSHDRMKPLGLLGLFDVSWFSDNHVVGCPNPQIPSDHLPLLVEFEMNGASV